MPRKRRGQAPTAAPGQTYGKAGEQKEAQRAVPMANRQSAANQASMENMEAGREQVERGRELKDQGRKRAERLPHSGDSMRDRGQQKMIEGADLVGDARNDLGRGVLGMGRDAALAAAANMQPPPPEGLLFQPTTRPDEPLTTKPASPGPQEPLETLFDALAREFGDEVFREMAALARMKGVK